METILKLTEREREVIKEVTEYSIAYQRDYSEVTPSVLFGMIEDLLNEVEHWKEQYEDELEKKENYNYEDVDKALEQDRRSIL